MTPMIDPNTLLAIALLPLGAAILAGLFGRLIGRTASHVVTIAAVGASFLLSALVAWQLLVQGALAASGQPPALALAGHS